MTDHLTRLMKSLTDPATKPLQRGSWQPAVDVYRMPDGWLLKFDLAGIRPADVKLAVSGNRVTIAGARRDWVVEKAERSYSMEISYNRFERTIELPGDLEDADMSTEYRDGMLLVRFTMEAKQ